MVEDFSAFARGGHGVAGGGGSVELCAHCDDGPRGVWRIAPGDAPGHRGGRCVVVALCGGVSCREGLGHAGSSGGRASAGGGVFATHRDPAAAGRAGLRVDRSRIVLGGNAVGAARSNRMADSAARTAPGGCLGWRGLWRGHPRLRSPRLEVGWDRENGALPDKLQPLAAGEPLQLDLEGHHIVLLRTVTRCARIQSEAACLVEVPLGLFAIGEDDMSADD